MKPPSLMQMMEKLIAIPSVSCVNADWDMSNLPVIEQLANWLNDCEFKVEVLPVNEGKANIIATRGHIKDASHGGLILAGHTDTVPFDEDRWQHNPFKLTEDNGRLYGLGTSDMKAFLGLAIEAAMSFDTKDFKNPLIILGTSDEETTMAGAQALVDACKPKARYAVIGEPTGLKPIRMHKGIMMEAVRITGLAGHSSNPALGHNALEAMHRVMSELMLWRDELQQKHHNPLFEVPVPTINLGHIHGGDNPNRICGSCELQIDIRPLPGMEISDLRAEMQQRLKRVLQETGVQFKTEALFDGVNAMETDKNAELVQLAEKMTQSESQVVAFSTEAPFYNAMGLQSIVMGPGSIRQAHQPDEYIEMKALQPAAEIIRQLIEHHCCSNQV